MGEKLSDRQLSELIGLIYDCALEPSRWSEAMEAIGRALRSDALILTLNDLKEGRSLIDHSLGWTPEWRHRRDEHLPEVNACLTEWFSNGPSLDDPFVASRHLSSEYIAQSPYAQEVLGPLGFSDVMHLFLMRTPERLSELVVMHHERFGTATDHEIRMSALLLPHLRRAVTISGLLEAKEIEKGYLAEALDQVDLGVILAGEDGTILHSNKMAEETMREGTTLVDDRGTLAATNPSATRELRKAIKCAARDRASLGHAGIAVRAGPDKLTSISAHVLPLERRCVGIGNVSQAIAAVFIGKPPRWEVAAEAVSAEFGLTEAEKRLLTILLSGSSLGEASKTLGVSANTVKSHLSNIFSKTGVHRQRELPRLAMQVVTSHPHAGRPGDRC